jgi:hypothetical protein
MGGNLTIRLLVAPPSKGIVIKGAGVLANPMARHIEDQPRRREEAIGPVERFVRSKLHPAGAEARTYMGPFGGTTEVMP